MLALIQRVLEARVEIAGELAGAIDQGLLVFLGVEKDDTRIEAERLLKKVLAYSVFADAEGKMNLSVKDIAGGLLLVPQFTLAADTQKGMRASLTPAAPPQEGERLFGHLLAQARRQHAPVESGIFGADMQVTLTNDGPVTFWLES